jgi:SPP1 family predicted phage head-tail adaptor
VNDIAYFPTITTIEDELGQIEQIEDFNKLVFCEKKSVSRDEFFQAGQNGIKSNCILIVYQMDYNEESKVLYRDKKYDIYRTYERPDERIELYCEVKIGGN